MKRLHTCLWLFACCLTPAICAEPTRPNVIVILADDLGYADLGCQGSKDVKTPHIDSIAQNGVRFTNGYVSSPQCGPSRAGLLTGRYQNRFGFESNEFAGKSIPRTEKLISERMKEVGYVTGYVGKWGVGNKRGSGLEFIPPQRGFDESYWNSGGNFHFSATPGGHDVQFYRGNEMVEQPHYSTDAIGAEAVEFVKRNRDKPFFLFVSHITPHVPMQADKEDLARFPDAEDPLRKTMLAMMAGMDDNIGQLLQALKEEGLEENTLVIFLSDNGGPTKSNASLNTPFRGGKSDVFEGGIRIPFLMQWKGKIPAGTVYEKPIISLDILPTALAASGVEINPEWKLDGVNLLPFLSGKKTEAPHDTLYWRFNRLTAQPENNCWAIRQGDWVLLSNHVGNSPAALYDLSKDTEQRINLAEAHPERVSEMRKRWETWNAEHPELPKSDREKQSESQRKSKQTSKKEAPVNAEAFQIAEIFSSDMILQREVPVPVWGRAPDGTVVTISFHDKEFATTSEKGQWRVNLPAMPASSEPVEMTVSAHLASGVEIRRFTNILVGDVWFVSGQSNMAMRLSEAAGGSEAVAESNNPHLRHFTVPRPETPADHLQQGCGSRSGPFLQMEKSDNSKLRKGLSPLPKLALSGSIPLDGDQLPAIATAINDPEFAGIRPDIINLALTDAIYESGVAAMAERVKTLPLTEEELKRYMDSVIKDGSGSKSGNKLDILFTNPEATLQWVAEARSETYQVEMIPNMVLNWAKRDANPAFGWVGRQASSPLRDTSISELVTKSPNLDRTSAEDWAREIQDQALRESTLQQLLKAGR